MKILHVTPILGPANGGSAVMPLNLAREQARAGNEITIATSNYQLDESILDLPKEVQVVSFECSRLLRSTFYSPGMKGWLISNSNKFDVIHLHNLRSYQSIIVHGCATSHSVPYLLQAHGSATIVGGKDLVKRIFDAFWGRAIVRDASACIAVSGREIDHYVDLGTSRESIRVIPNALETSRLPQPERRGQFKAEHGIAADAEVILFVGRLNWIKGIDVLIRAFARLHDDRRSAVLVIVGPDDGEETKLRELVNSLGLMNEVKFIGFRSSPIPAYRDADVLAYPSRYEVFGLVPFEAIWHGTPIVVTSANGCGEIISEVGCGLTVPTDDEVALLNSIHRLLDNPSEGQTMVRKGRGYIENNLTWENVVSQLDRAYMDAIDKGGKKV